MLTENKIGRYLIYAIGEIILVMIGILLALQVNNWNESKKDRNRKDEAIKPPMKCRENKLTVKTSIGLCSMDNHSGRPDKMFLGFDCAQ